MSDYLNKNNMSITPEYLKHLKHILSNIKDIQLLLKGIFKTSDDRELLLEALLVSLIEKLDNHKEPAERLEDWDDVKKAMKRYSSVGTTTTTDPSKYWSYLPINQIDIEKEIENLSNEFKKQEIINNAKPVTVESLSKPFTET
jgi:hypothetical protein